MFSNTPHWWTATQGCGAGLAEAISLAHLLTSHSLIQKPQKLKCPPKTTMTLLVSLASYILASLHLHTSHASHIFTITTLPHYHLAWEFEKPFIISFITLPFIQPKINGLLIYVQVCSCVSMSLCVRWDQEITCSFYCTAIWQIIYMYVYNMDLADKKVWLQNFPV